MVILSKSILKQFSEKHPEAETALLKWYDDTKAAGWNNFPEVKKTSTLLMRWEMTAMFLILRVTITGW